MHPDRDLAGLLGITSAGTTLSDGYLQVNTATPPGHGITGQTIQFHGSADRYTAQRRDRGRDAVQQRDHRDREPGGDAAQRRGERRPGRRVHLRPRRARSS